MSVVHKRSRHQLPRIQTGTEDLGGRPPSEMSDTELLRFGMQAKYMCSKDSGLDEGRQQIFAAQFNKARNEWNKRCPRLPLAATFSEEEPETPGVRPHRQRMQAPTLSSSRGRQCSPVPHDAR